MKFSQSKEYGKTGGGSNPLIIYLDISKALMSMAAL
jgi:hypothetical protein